MAFRELDYQARALAALDAYLVALSAEKPRYDKVTALAAADPDLGLEPPHYPEKAWASLAAAGQLPPSRVPLGYSQRLTGDGKPCPNATLKVPTGGGKTYLACAGLSRIFGGYLKANTGFVLWIVPNEAIYSQTVKALRDRDHPYRQTLDRAAAGRVVILEKGDALKRADVDASLCVMVLMLQSSNRENQSTLKLFQDRGDVHGFTPPEGDQAAHAALLKAVPNLTAYDLADGGPGWPMIKDSVGNALRIIRPVVIMDEGQKAVSELAFGTLYGFNPCFVLELSATPVDVAPKKATATKAGSPGRTANILVEITGRELEREGMIKMPLNLEPVPGTDWQAAMRAALHRLNGLAASAEAYLADGGRYIRPILLVQVERTGADQADTDMIHADHVKAWLMKAGLDEAEIAFKTAEINDLDKPENRDLLSPSCRVRVVITKAALAEGWDCPFAYVLCSLAANGAEGAMTQLVGRILRQPHATKTGVAALDECYVYTHRADTKRVVEAIKDGLSRDGLSDLVRDIVLSDGGAAAASVKRAVQRRDAFRTFDIALPQVLWVDPGRTARQIDPETDLYPLIDWTACDMAAFADAIPKDARTAESQIVRLRTAAAAGFETETQRGEEIERQFDPAFAVRMISDLSPNPFVGRAMVGEVLAKLKARGFDESLIGRLSGFIIDELRRYLGAWRDAQSAVIFRDRLADGQIQFQIRGDEGDWIMPDRDWTTADEAATQLAGQTGAPLERSLFLPIYAADLNNDERSVAVYLDDTAAIRWWHRNGTSRNSYAIRGWRRGNVYPDFVFAALKGDSSQRIVALESKGDQLAGNLDTAYKTALLSTLTNAWGSGETRALGRGEIDFEAAVVLFSDMKLKLPVLIAGDEKTP
ncbi:DEAD/DEAH box helicase [Brevundimonas sp.]|uniref:DEAD/DEAH box helicase n=1 Tax=Brevundimonas sp. TaxID=1871086 RepID=UPI002ED81D66